MLFPSSLSPGSLAAEAPQAPKSDLTVYDELLYQMSVSTGKSPIFPTHAQLSDFLLLLFHHCYFLQERSGCTHSRALNETRGVGGTCVSFPLLLTVFSPRGHRPVVQPFRPASPNSMCCDCPFQESLPLPCPWESHREPLVGRVDTIIRRMRGGGKEIAPTPNFIPCPHMRQPGSA